jgi:hypothetical protein
MLPPLAVIDPGIACSQMGSVVGCPSIDDIGIAMRRQSIIEWIVWFKMEIRIAFMVVSKAMVLKLMMVAHGP